MDFNFRNPRALTNDRLRGRQLTRDEEEALKEQRHRQALALLEVARQQQNTPSGAGGPLGALGRSLGAGKIEDPGAAVANTLGLDTRKISNAGFAGLQGNAPVPGPGRGPAERGADISAPQFFTPEDITSQQASGQRRDPSNDEAKPPGPPRAPGGITVGDFSIGTKGVFFSTEYTDPFITEFGVIFVDSSGSGITFSDSPLPTPSSVELFVEEQSCSRCSTFKLHTSKFVGTGSPKTMEISVPSGKVLRVGVTPNEATGPLALVTIRI